MPLSDHEQRLLDEIEQALYAEDPKFVSSVRSVRAPSRRRRNLLLSIFGVILGLGLVLVGLVTSIVPLSVVGFVLVVAAIGFAVQGFRSHSDDLPDGVHDIRSAPRGNARQQRSGGLRGRMEDRLRRRFDEG
jgi:hypothetical protein